MDGLRMGMPHDLRDLQGLRVHVLCPGPGWALRVMALPGMRRGGVRYLHGLPTVGPGAKRKRYPLRT